MDFLRTAYETDARLWVGDATLTRIRWFRAGDSALLAPQPNRYVSGVWDDRKIWPVASIGDVFPRKTSYSKGENILGLSGLTHCGSDLAWRTGGVHGRDEPIVTDTEGYSACCGVPSWVTDGGAGAGGASVFPLVCAGGVEIGGSVEGGPFVAAIGGVLVGGSVEALPAPPESVAGGVLVGGSVEGGPFTAFAGGLLVGGQVRVVDVPPESVAGGVLVGGSVEGGPFTAFAGGLLVGGLVEVVSPGPESFLGGLLVGGSVEVVSPGPESFLGGLLVGGSVDGGFPGPTITRTFLNLSQAKSVTSRTIAGLTVNAGELLMVGVSLRPNGAGVLTIAATWDGSPMIVIGQQTFSPAGGIHLAALYFPVVSNTTGDVVVSWGGATVAGVMALAVKVSGLPSNSLDLFQQGPNLTTGTAASSGTSGTSSTADEFVWGLVATNGPRSDTLGSWTSPLTGGQYWGTLGGVDSTNASLREGYYVASATGTFEAEVTGMTSRPWLALLVSFS